MCGIVGFNWNDQELLKQMTSLLEHRGPDNQGYYSNKNISLGHRRLSIIDLSSAGKMPMSNEDETIWIAYNGEIYNFKELRLILEEKGHRFKSNTDTEVIVHGYEEWNELVVEKLNGEFAFAIWDEKNNQLFLARDRLGIKPLYYYWNKNKLLFSSEIKPILLEQEIKRKINLSSLNQYLNLRYIPGEETIFEGVKKLLPGHTIILNKKSLTIKKFWDAPFAVNQNDKNTLEKTEFLLNDSVKKRLIADVPLGIYLSGGIDSASLVALTSKLKPETIKTFSVGFDYSNEVDELQKARKIANYFQTDHQEIVVKGNISELLPKIIWHLDQPHGDPVIIPMLKLSELASKKVKVVLSGEGADEVFGGYVQYKAMLQAQKVKMIPKLLTKNITKHLPIKLLDRFFDYPSSIGEKGKEKVMDFIEDLKSEPKAYQDLISIMSKRDQQFLLTEKIRNKGINEKENYFQPDRKPLLNRLLYYDTKTWLPNYVLYINDRLTMANSIEGRVPFLDHRLVEEVNKLPSSWKIKGKVNKYLLRKAMQKELPLSILKAKKHAFFMPLDRWYEEELKSLAEELFTPYLVKERGHFNYEYLKKIWEKYPSSKLLYGKQLFTLINLELWQRMFIDSEKLPPNNRIKLSSLL